MADSDRSVERRARHPMVARGCVGAAPRRQGHAPGVTPWPAPASAVGARLERGIGVSGRGRGVEKMNRRADMRGPCGSGSRRAEGAWACWAGSWAARACWEDGKEVGRPVGLAGWRGPSRPSLRGLLLPFFFFCFIFPLLYLNSILIFKFGFQIGSPNSLEF